MRNPLIFLVIIGILILGTVGISYDVFAESNSNNGSNGCLKSNPNSKACEKNPNTVTCADCWAEIQEAYEACGDNVACQEEAVEEYWKCAEKTRLDCEEPPPPGSGGY